MHTLACLSAPSARLSRESTGSTANRSPTFDRRCTGLGPGNGNIALGLTDRESEIVVAIAAAYSNKDIAHLFAISETTVKHHLTNIFDKTGMSTRLELAMFAVSHGLQTDATLTSLTQ